MLTLRNSHNSPFGRKVVVALQVLGLSDKVQTVVADTGSASDNLRQQNPLGKIPTLVLDDGTSLFDSRVISEYLNELDGRHRLFPQGMARFAVLREQALADGILDAAILIVYESRYRPAEHHVEKWLEHQRGKLNRGLDEAERSIRPLASGGPDAGNIAMACCLGYLDFRFPGTWREQHPKLVAWLAGFERDMPGFAASAPKA